MPDGRVTWRVGVAIRHCVLAIRHLLERRGAAALLCVAALLLKVLVPAGYMVDSHHGRTTIVLCSGTVPHVMTPGMAGMHDATPDHGKTKDHGKAEMPCAFAGLSTASLASADPIQIAALVAFLSSPCLVGLAGAAPPAEPAKLRPPLRAPPASL